MRLSFVPSCRVASADAGALLLVLRRLNVVLFRRALRCNSRAQTAARAWSTTHRRHRAVATALDLVHSLEPGYLTPSKFKIRRNRQGFARIH
jgi:hypothetical protein